MRNQTIHDLCTACRKHSKIDRLDSCIALIISRYVLLEAMVNFQWYAVIKRAEKAGISLTYESADRVVIPLLSDKPPDPPPLEQKLLQGPEQGNTWIPNVLRRLKYDTLLNGFSFRSLLGACSNSGPAAVSRYAFLVDHARQTPTHIRFKPIREWFRPVESLARAQEETTPIPDTLIREMVNSIKQGFSEGNEPFPAVLKEYFENWIRSISVLTKLHFKRLIDPEKNLPSEIWTGSGGHIWARILRAAVRYRGGKIVGHDHGGWKGFIHMDIRRVINELEFCDEFITFSKAEKRSLKASVEPNLIVSNPIPTIRAISSEYQDEYQAKHLDKNSSSNRSNQNEIEKIIYPSTEYLGERVHITPETPDLTKMDWTCRLVAKLMSWDYEVILKPHPLGEGDPSERIADYFNCQIRHDPFEEVMHEADLILFDYLHTTILKPIFLSGIPLMYIDFGMDHWFEEGRKAFEEKCRIVEAKIDGENRIVVDWEDVRKGIRDAQEFTDNEFLETYLIN